MLWLENAETWKRWDLKTVWPKCYDWKNLWQSLQKRKPLWQKPLTVVITCYSRPEDRTVVTEHAVTEHTMKGTRARKRGTEPPNQPPFLVPPLVTPLQLAGKNIPQTDLMKFWPKNLSVSTPSPLDDRGSYQDLKICIWELQLAAWYRHGEVMLTGSYPRKLTKSLKAKSNLFDEMPRKLLLPSAANASDPK